MDFNEAQIRVIRHEDNDGFVPDLEPAFVVLGMLDEYLGRKAVEGGTTVERFYPHEGAVADLFVRYLRQFAMSLESTSQDVQVVRADSGHWSVESKSMTARVNALYRFEYPDDQVITMADGRRLRCAWVALGPEHFPKKSSMRYEAAEMNPRFSYLYGVLLRYSREDGVIRLANASQKVALIQRVLAELDVLWITHRYSVDGAPQCNDLSFEPRPRLQPFIARALAERAQAVAAANEGVTPGGVA